MISSSRLCVYRLLFSKDIATWGFADLREKESSAVGVQGTATINYNKMANGDFSVKASFNEFLLYSYWLGHASTCVPLAKPFNAQVCSTCPCCRLFFFKQ
jgi:hypothetical protein